MASSTPRFGLLKKDPVADAADTFNIDTMLNNQWDALDGAAKKTELDFEAQTRQVENIGAGVQTGLDVIASATPDMNVTAQAGVVYMADGKRFDLAAKVIAVTAADATNPRKDIVYVSAVGVIEYLAGTAAATPVEPTLPAGAFQLCAIDVPAADTAIEQAQITDKRGTLKKTLASHLSDTANPHGVTASQVGAVSKSGDTMSGSLEINAGTDYAEVRSVRTVSDIPYMVSMATSGLGYGVLTRLNNGVVDGSISIISTSAVRLNGVNYFNGTGSPEGVISAGVGSIYTRTDGGAATTLYVKESGTGNAGWVAK